MTTPLWRHWQAYWFAPAPLVNLAMCRILFVGFQLVQLVWAGDVWSDLHRLAALPDTFYDSLPVLHLFTMPWGWSARPSLAVLDGLYGLTLVAGISGLAGWRTNLSLLVFAAGNLFLQAFMYSFGEMHHPEALFMVALGLLALGPSGAAWSLDSRRRRPPTPSLRATSAFARWPLLVVQWLLALAYFSSASSKLASSGFGWANGYTLQYYLIEDGLRWHRPLGVWMGQQHLPVMALSWLTLVFEGTFFLVLIWSVLAWVYLPLGAAFHAGIYLAMDAPFFQLIVLYAAFIPWADVVDRIQRWMRWREAALPR